MNAYERRKYEKWKKEEEKLMGRGFFARFIEATILFCICSYLIRIGVYHILAVKVPLIVIALIVGAGILIVRTYLWRKRHDDY